MSAPKVVLILGAGANVGTSVAKKFRSEGWKVAAAARTIREETSSNADFTMSVDLTNPTNVSKLFTEVESKLGFPNVVVYNAYSSGFVNGQDPFSAVSAEDFAKHLSVNVTSFYEAAHLAVQGWKKLSADTPKVFIYTGNMESSMIVPEIFCLGVGKVCSTINLQGTEADKV